MITRKRSRGERPYSVIKRIYYGGHVFVTTVPRVRVKAMFMCLGHNPFQLVVPQKEGDDNLCYLNCQEITGKIDRN